MILHRSSKSVSGSHTPASEQLTVTAAFSSYFFVLTAAASDEARSVRKWKLSKRCRIIY